MQLEKKADFGKFWSGEIKIEKSIGKSDVLIVNPVWL